VLRKWDEFLTGSRCCDRSRALIPEAEEHIIHCILQSRIGLVKLSGRLGSKLTKLVTVVDMSQSAKNQFRTHKGIPRFLIMVFQPCIFVHRTTVEPAWGPKAGWGKIVPEGYEKLDARSGASGQLFSLFF
jgi:hypothetical protein